MNSRNKAGKLIFGLIFITFAVLPPYACGAPGTSEGSTVQLTEADSGRMIEVNVGDQLNITLPANPTTGFQWEVSTIDSTIVRPIGEPEFEPAGNEVGSGGQVKFRFEVVGRGQTDLQLIHHRTFEENMTPIQTFEVNITAK